MNMMNSTLNLLPPQKRKIVASMLQFLFVKNLLEITIIVGAIISIILLWSWLMLLEEFQNLSINAVQVSRGYSSRNQEIRQLNKIIINLERSGAGFTLVSDNILDIARILPPDIKLRSLNLSRRANRIDIYGTANTRPSLLAFEEALRKLGWINEIHAPASRLLEKENINFELQLKVKGWPALPSLPAPKPSSPSL